MVGGVLHHAAISSLNWSEVYQKALARSVQVDGLRNDLETLGLVTLPFGADDAEQAATLWTAGSSLSLADRACLALGIRYRPPVWTTDRAWAQAATGADIRVLRP